MSETVAQVAIRRHVHRRTVINWISKGRLEAHRKGYGPTSPWLIDAECPAPEVEPIRSHFSQARRSTHGSPPPHRLAESPIIDRVLRPTERPGHPDQHSPNEPRYVADPDIDQCQPEASIHVGHDSDNIDDVKRWLRDHMFPEG